MITYEFTSVDFPCFISVQWCLFVWTQAMWGHNASLRTYTCLECSLIFRRYSSEANWMKNECGDELWWVKEAFPPGHSLWNFPVSHLRSQCFLAIQKVTSLSPCSTRERMTEESFPDLLSQGDQVTPKATIRRNIKSSLGFTLGETESQRTVDTYL